MMRSIELTSTPIDDPAFVALVSTFVSHYADLYRSRDVTVIHIDNWFGERWLGFAGTFQGIAGIRNRSLHASLPTPPFRPSRVVSVLHFDRNDDGTYTGGAGSPTLLHVEKNGGVILPLFSPGLYGWYSGNTMSNTTASLMLYDVTRKGNNAWYLMFARRDEWGVAKCVNVSRDECVRIMKSHQNPHATEPPGAPEPETPGRQR